MKNLTGWSKDRPDVKSPDRLSAIRPHVGTIFKAVLRNGPTSV